jgi:hypothetical protein
MRDFPFPITANSGWLGEAVHSGSVWAAEPVESIQWIDSSDERRELEWAAGRNPAKMMKSKKNG